MPYDRDLVARMYDGDYAVLRTPSGDVEFYVDQARRTGGPVLELACGTGRVVVPTARAGIEVTGVDASAAMLTQARENLAREPAEVRRRATLCQGDMCTVDAGRRFALVTIPFRPLSHLLALEQQLALFRNVRRHLLPHGRLVFDVFQPNPAFLTGPREERLDLEREEGGRRIRRFSRARPHLATQVIDVTFRWEIQEPSGKLIQHAVEFPMRWYHRFELEHLLARCGFRLLALYGDFQRGALTDETWEMVFVAEPTGDGR